MSVYVRRSWTQTGALNTNGVANTITNVVILAAPGAGLRYRIFGIWAHKSSMAAAALAASVQWRYFASNPIGGVNQTLGLISASAGAAGGAMGGNHSYEPVGLAVTVNQPVNLQSIADVATVGFNAGIIYAIEPST